jgi:hypothetical protein
MYFYSQVWDYVQDLIPDLFTNNKPYIFIVYLLDNGYIIFDTFKAQHIHIKFLYKTKLLHFIQLYNKSHIHKIKWSGNIKHTIDFSF